MLNVLVANIYLCNFFDMFLQKCLGFSVKLVV